jgi:hypothetical protein
VIPSAPNVLPEWLEQPATELARAVAPQPEPALPTPVAEPLPDWLKQPAIELARAVVPETSASEALDVWRDLEPEDELPDWLQFLTHPETEPAWVDAPATSPQGAPVALAPARATPPVGLAQADPVYEFFDALRSGNARAAGTYYGPHFALVSQAKVLRDLEAVDAFYQNVLRRLDPRTLNILSLRGSRAAISVRWAARDLKGGRLQGTDTIHLNRDGLIAYHQTALPD